MPTLNVYVTDGCWSCEETRVIVAEMQHQFPEVEIALLDLHPELWPDEVFAVPTYMLDGRVISLGNPSREKLQNKIVAAKATTQGSSENGVTETVVHTTQ